MAGSPKYKVHNPQGVYIASCKHIEDAAMIVAGYGDGAKIKIDGKTYWNEGAEAFPAGESYDSVASIVSERELTAHRERFKKVYGYYPD